MRSLMPLIIIVIVVGLFFGIRSAIFTLILMCALNWRMVKKQARNVMWRIRRGMPKIVIKKEKLPEIPEEEVNSNMDYLEL